MRAADGNPSTAAGIVPTSSAPAPRARMALKLRPERPCMRPSLSRYVHWLHTRWPAGRVEKLPEVNPDGTTAVAGVRVVGDLTGIP